MTFQRSYEILKEQFNAKDFSKIDTDFSVQVIITGKDGGNIYLAYINGQKIIEPIKHKTANMVVTLSDTTFDDLINKRLEPFKAFTTGKVKTKGNVFLALSLYKKYKKI